MGNISSDKFTMNSHWHVFSRKIPKKPKLSEFGQNGENKQLIEEEN